MNSDQIRYFLILIATLLNIITIGLSLDIKYYLKFDDEVSSRLQDIPYINGHYYTKGKMIFSETAILGESLDFTKDYYVIWTNRRNECLLSPDLCQNGLTLCFWMKAFKHNQSMAIYFANGAHYKKSYGLAVNDIGNVLTLSISDGTTLHGVAMTHIYNNWQHYCLTYKDANLNFYLNGTWLAKGGNGTKNYTNPVILNNFVLGKDPYAPQLYYSKFYLDELRFWEEEKNSSFIKNIHKTQGKN